MGVRRTDTQTTRDQNCRAYASKVHAEGRLASAWKQIFGLATILVLLCSLKPTQAAGYYGKLIEAPTLVGRFDSLADSPQLDADDGNEVVVDFDGPQAAAALVERLVGSLRQQDGDLNEQQRDYLRHLSNVPLDDLNYHLGPTGKLADDQIDADIEALLSQLTGSLNLVAPNTGNRSEAIGRLLASYSRQPSSRLILSLSSSPAPTRSSDDDDDDDIEDAGSEQTVATPQTSEYFDTPLELFGAQLVQGGAGEGRQLLGPDGTFENAQVVKSEDSRGQQLLPTYCEPPNPCPLGYTAADGCLEQFVNSASFSREYQASKQCSCDNEHSLFNCELPAAAAR